MLHGRTQLLDFSPGNVTGQQQELRTPRVWALAHAQSKPQAPAERRYVRPEFAGEGEEPQLVIREGRHPVLAAALGEATVVPNDTELRGRAGPRVAVVTGPNMGGKSCYIRQAALIAVMAQVGTAMVDDPARQPEHTGWAACS